MSYFIPLATKFVGGRLELLIASIDDGLDAGLRLHKFKWRRGKPDLPRLQKFEKSTLAKLLTQGMPRTARHQRRIPGLDQKILSLYAEGMSLRDMQRQLEEVYQAGLSASYLGGYRCSFGSYLRA